MKTVMNLRLLFTAGDPAPSRKAAALLYLHGARTSASVRLKVEDIGFGASPTAVLVRGSRPIAAYVP